MHTWYEHKDSAARQHVGFSLGTIIGPGVILTHNHFNFHPESRNDEALTLIPITGQAFTLAITGSQLMSVGCMQTLSMLSNGTNELAAAYVAANTGCNYSQAEAAGAAFSIDPGTLIIHFPRDIMPVPVPLGDQATFDQLVEGQWLTVDYWDEPRQHLAQGNFQVVQVVPGLATLADPQCLIRPGDSGGGVYLKGRLVGNTWSIYTDADQPAGMFNVALIPVGALPTWQPEQTLAAATLADPAKP